MNAARELNVDWHIGITASVDTFFEGRRSGILRQQEFTAAISAASPNEYRALGILNYEMESGTLFKMANAYGFAAACICAVIAERTQSEHPNLEAKKRAVHDAIRVASTRRRNH